LGSRDNYDFNTTFLHKFDDEGHEIQIMGTMSGNLQDQVKRNYRETVPWINVLEWSDSTFTDESYQTIQADYVKPLGLVKLETGVRSRFRQIDFENRNSQNPFNQVYSGRNHLLYDDGIHALYFMGSSKIEKWEFQLGLRTEYYKIVTLQESNNAKNTKEDINVFPTLHVSNSTGKNKFMAGYSRRVNRPNIRFLNPYEEFDDAYNVDRGNPDLDPEFSHSVEFNYLRYFGQSTASANLFYRQTDNAISRVRRLYDPLSNNGVMLNTFENMNKQASLGVEASVRHSFTKWFQFDGNYSFFRYSIEGQTNNQPVNTSSINHSFRTNLVFRIGKNTTLSANAMYNSPSVTAQGKRGAFFNNGISVRQQVLDRRGTITLSARNPIGKFRWEFESRGEGFDDYFYRQPYMPILTAGFSYRLNEGVRRKRSSNGERTEEFSSDMEL
jgi:outer membrane cobalamin receptor